MLQLGEMIWLGKVEKSPRTFTDVGDSNVSKPGLPFFG